MKLESYFIGTIRWKWR